MVLRRWEPFGELRRMHENMDRLWSGGYVNQENGSEIEAWAIPMDVVEEGDNILVHASMPGVNPDEIEVTVENDVLTIKAQSSTEREHKEGNYLMKERRTGYFHRSLHLPDTVNSDQATPHYEQGVLTVTLPKVEAKKARKLTVVSGNVLEGEKK
ncbi:MAG: Hsp20/alpha crystallin family protein [Chloroflexi bacterium]|nr:Hsp20/alpha crystallin family protein [Chloroflexota bacterium]MDA1219471.1 Hsp20/alpha crystallin family protein [Chloroflexota bacterium]MQC24803.1 Hsp20/alpha crystallin family protein [Chloroflexota bacterium]